MIKWDRVLDSTTAFGVFSNGTPACPYAEVGLNTNSVASATGAWTSANLAYFHPILVRDPITVYQLGWLNGPTVSGNVDVGIYNSSRSRLVSAGSTAQGTLSTIQMIDIADTTLAPGLYYTAMSCDNTTSTFQRFSLQLQLARCCGLAQQASALPLPSTATFVAQGNAFMPLIFGSIQGAVL